MASLAAPRGRAPRAALRGRARAPRRPSAAARAPRPRGADAERAAAYERAARCGASRPAARRRRRVALDADGVRGPAATAARAPCTRWCWPGRCPAATCALPPDVPLVVPRVARGKWSAMPGSSVPALATSAADARHRVHCAVGARHDQPEADRRAGDCDSHSHSPRHGTPSRSAAAMASGGTRAARSRRPRRSRCSASGRARASGGPAPGRPRFASLTTPRSKPVAITVTWISSPSRSSTVAPKMMLQLSSAAPRTISAISIASCSERSVPPETASRTPVAPWISWPISGDVTAACAASRRAVRALGPADAHERRAGVLHDRADVGEVEVDQARAS